MLQTVKTGLTAGAGTTDEWQDAHRVIVVRTPCGN